MTKPSTFFTIIILATTAFASAASAQQEQRPSMDGVAAELGVSVDMFENCMAGVVFEGGGAGQGQPSRAQMNNIRSVLLPCLQIENPDISGRDLGKAMRNSRG